MNRERLVTTLNLLLTLAALTSLTVATRTEFILPPFIATAGTKFADPQWKYNRTAAVIEGYLICSAIAVVTVLLGGVGLLAASVAVMVSWLIMILLSVEHPPALLAAFLGVLNGAHPFFIIHPVLSGIIVEEVLHYVLTRWLK